MIKKSISQELRNKIVGDMILLRPMEIDTWECEGMLSFDKNEKHLYIECCDWFKIIKKFFSTSYNACRIKRIGNYEGIRPLRVFEDLNVEFSINHSDSLSWKDWFIQDEDDLNFIKE